ncbi:MAG: hypothetical protein NC832_01190 [Candidatus Omnitrophica bacterium]|nr:hypothetical protein [Candidatus Omnitrophota bacterium]
MNRKNKWHLPVIVIVAFGAIFLLNYFNSKKPPVEQVQGLISQHRAAIVFVKSNTEKDREFLEVLKEAKYKMKEKGGIVFAGADFLEGKGQPPALIVFDAHGNLLGILTAPLDRQIFEEMVHSIATHSH